jgi:hypothetical protein
MFLRGSNQTWKHMRGLFILSMAVCQISFDNLSSLLAKASKFIAEYDQLGALHRSLARNQLEGELSTLQQDLDSFGARFRVRTTRNMVFPLL